MLRQHQQQQEDVIAEKPKRERWDVTLSISKQTHKNLIILAKAEDRPLSWIIDRLIRNRLKQLKIDPAGTEGVSNN